MMAKFITVVKESSWRKYVLPPLPWRPWHISLLLVRERSVCSSPKSQTSEVKYPFLPVLLRAFGNLFVIWCSHPRACCSEAEDVSVPSQIRNLPSWEKEINKSPFKCKTVFILIVFPEFDFCSLSRFTNLMSLPSELNGVMNSDSLASLFFFFFFFSFNFSFGVKQHLSSD